MAPLWLPNVMSFDTLAPYYPALEWVCAGTLMQRSRVAFVAEAVGCRRALVLGEGPGRFLPALLVADAGVAVTCVEMSDRMIELARDRLARHRLDQRRVEFVQADALDWSPSPGAFDLVVTHYFLDCFLPEQLRVLVRRLALGAAATARWLVADFRLPESGWRRWRARSIVGLLYGFFHVTAGVAATNLTPPDDHLRAAGFRLARRRAWSHGLIHSDVWRRPGS